VDLEGTRHALGAAGLEAGRVVGLSIEGERVEGERVAALSEGGRVLLSHDEGAHFELAALPEGVVAATVVIASGLTWVRTRTGSLLAARFGKGLERLVVPGVLVSLAADGTGGVVGLAVDEGGRPATLVRGRQDGTVACEALEAPAGRAGSAVAGWGRHSAYVIASGRGVAVQRPGAGWQRFAWEGRVTALSFVDDAGTLVAATYAETDDTTGLVRLDTAGRISLVARVEASRDDADADGRAVALVYDDLKGVVWVAGGFGIAAFAVR
jgi:hypothetical protein